MAISTPSSGSTIAGNEQIQVIQPQSQLITVKLSEGNYLLWRQQVLAAARGYGLENYLTGAEEIPQEFVPGTSDTQATVNPTYTLWARQDQLLVSWLLSSVSENVLITTVGLSSSKEIWDCLESSFASQSRAKVMQYRLQLHTLKKGNMSMREYLNKIKACCDMLGAAGQKLSEEDQILYILSGLGNEYDSVMVSITSRFEPCSLREAYALLLTFESRLEGPESSNINVEGSIPTVNFASQNSGPRRGAGNQGGRGRNPSNFYTNRGGRNSNRRGPYRGRGGRFGFNRPRCQVCQIFGHTADKCYYRFDANYVPSSNNTVTSLNHGNFSSNTPHIGGPTANIASTGTMDNTQEICWYPDSGASNHVTYDFGNLNLASEYHGADKIQVGNGTGVWFMHCHFERHVSWGMGMVFIVKNGLNAKILPPPKDMPRC